MVAAGFTPRPAAVPGQQRHSGEDFPLVLECPPGGATLDVATEWAAAHRD